MKDAFASDLETVLKTMKWPGKDCRLAGSLEHEWTDNVERLLELQEPYAHLPAYFRSRPHRNHERSVSTVGAFHGVLTC